MSMGEAARQLRYLLAPLDQWRFDPAVDEIAINKPGEVFVRSKGQFVRHDMPLDYDDLYDIAVLAGAHAISRTSVKRRPLAIGRPAGRRTAPGGSSPHASRPAPSA